MSTTRCWVEPCFIALGWTEASSIVMHGAQVTGRNRQIMHAEDVSLAQVKPENLLLYGAAASSLTQEAVPVLEMNLILGVVSFFLELIVGAACEACGLRLGSHCPLLTVVLAVVQVRGDCCYISGWFPLEIHFVTAMF